MTPRTPFLLVGDGPHEPTGLGRIARDLGRLIVGSFGDQLQLVSIGGSVPPVWTAWPHYPLDPKNEDWGAAQVTAYYRDLFGSRPGVLMVVWDPARLYSYAAIDLPVQKWAYTAIDATNVHGRIDGPGGEALRQFDRVLAYGRWASHAVKAARGEGASYLPHGLDWEMYDGPATNPPDEPEHQHRRQMREWVEQTLGPFCRPQHTVIGCVATNQPRKDLSLYFGTLAELKARGRQVYGWLHTDQWVKAWSVPQLVQDFGLEKQITVTGVDGEVLTDQQLAAMYRRCDLTLAPGLGEGFGYPIVESLASGTPVIHGDCGGGAELVPKTEWRVPVREWRFEGVYAQRRPVMRIEDWANAAERALGWQVTVGRAAAQGYCRGSVAHLDWARIAGRWQGWIRAGLEGRG